MNNKIELKLNCIELNKPWKGLFCGTFLREERVTQFRVKNYLNQLVSFKDQYQSYQFNHVLFGKFQYLVPSHL